MDLRGTDKYHNLWPAHKGLEGANSYSSTTTAGVTAPNEMK